MSIDFKVQLSSKPLVERTSKIFFFPKIGTRYFVSSVDHLFNRIEDNPFQFPVFYDDRRKAILLDFPYKIIFFLDQDTAVIIAFVHHARDPKRYLGR